MQQGQQRQVLTGLGTLKLMVEPYCPRKAAGLPAELLCMLMDLSGTEFWIIILLGVSSATKAFPGCLRSLMHCISGVFLQALH